ncbi:aluminum-activated malate transporter 2-like isoform X2 [Mangifera indica]|uniref:aluminum-activated malate transporter 2-like isoform X1 n=1 Tax=Mangifera indica TaxID=29780 RepID=UPI001CFB69D1|nr:aluminum-activated malate transporter 2-like isoform X1 [Mangifera indica]XP_044475518.1 aluminum-activated malate transporter 2-like isoform X2 [Mangifera indica]
MVSSSGKKEGIMSRCLQRLSAFPGKIRKLGQDDPRRITHSLKVGLAITLVSLFYYFEPLYSGFGDSTVWAILTVVVVFEFSVGATLGRGLNRGLATFMAGALGFGAHRLASLSGNKGEPILLALFVFLIAAAVTFLRFFPRMKARYDYGLLIFILTFCMITVSGYRDEELLEMAHQRISTILIGGFTAVAVCIFIFPVWAGDDLHNLVANNIEKLAIFLEGFGPEYFKMTEDEESPKKVSEGFKSVLNSKQSEESMANFARWEPRHGKFRFRHPWKHYLKIASLTRQCAYRIEALNGCLNDKTQTPQEIRCKIQDASIQLCSESANTLKELALAIRTMTPPTPANQHLINSKIAAKNLKSLLNTGLFKETDLLEVIPVATMAYLLVDVVSCTEKIAESIQELASLAKFKSTKKHEERQAQPNLCPQRTMQRNSGISIPAVQPNLCFQRSMQKNSGISHAPHHVITIHQESPCLSVDRT